MDPSTSIGDAYPYVVIVGLLLLSTAAALRYRPPLGFGGLWFFLILLPTSSFLPIVNEVAAERRIYLSLAAPIALVVAAVHAGLEWGNQHCRGLVRWGGGFLTLIAVATLSCATVQRNRDYRSALSIWESVLSAVPDDPRAHYNMGNLLKSEGRIDAAIAHYHRALGSQYEHVESHNNLGVAYQLQGRLDMAIHHYNQALELNPGAAEVYYNLGNTLRSKGQPRAAIDHYRRALELDPNYLQAHNNTGIALKSLGQLDSAIAHYRKALELDEDHSDVRHNLAIALALKQGENAK